MGGKIHIDYTFGHNPFEAGTSFQYSDHWVELAEKGRNPFEAGTSFQ